MLLLMMMMAIALQKEMGWDCAEVDMTRRGRQVDVCASSCGFRPKRSRPTGCQVLILG